MNGLKLFHHSPNVGNGSQYTSFISNDLCRKIASSSPNPVGSARRKLFNVDNDSISCKDQTAALRVDLLNKFQSLRRNQSAKWNFDFGREMPLPGPYAWFKSESTSPLLPSSPVNPTNAMNPNNTFETKFEPKLPKNCAQTILSPTSSPFALFFANQSAQPCFNLECNSCTSTLTTNTGEINYKSTKCPIIPMHQTKITDYFHHHKKAALSSPISALTPPDSVLKKGGDGSCKRPLAELEQDADHNSISSFKCHKRLTFHHHL